MTCPTRRTSSGWHRVSRREPCPICEKPDWCAVTNDGEMVHCMRVPSARPCASGGWFHRVKEGATARTFVPMPARPQPPAPALDAVAAMAGFRAEFESYHGGRDIFDSLVEIGNELRLRPADIDRLLVGRSAHYCAWCFPMLDAGGTCCGIRLRRYGTSDKFSVRGSRDGLFYDPDLQPLESPADGINGRELVIMEGATDCIAGYALGLPCVGRSSCNTGGTLLRDLCERLRVSRVTIVSDNDGYKRRPDGTLWRPGIEGAERLAQQLGRCYRIVTPPKKDLREWVWAGVTAEQFWKMAQLMPWRVAR